MASGDEFVNRLQVLTAVEITAVAAALRAELGTADGELAWWQATIEVSEAIKRRRRTREAGLVAHRAATAVVDAARVAGIDDEQHRPDITAVARAAAEAARARILVHDGALATAAAAPLLHPWVLVAA